VWRRPEREHTASMLEPTKLRGSRVRVYGCSPGCLAASIVLSLLLTLAVNACAHAF